MLDPPILSVVCVKTGDKYSFDYVNNLKRSITRHLRVPFTFYCLTDDPTGLDEGILTAQPPEILDGWWNKMWVFSDLMPEGPLLYLDLDLVITGDITEIVEECLKHPFSCYRDHIDWMDCKLNSSLMAFSQSRQHLDIFQKFWDERDQLKDYPGGDQVWLSHHLDPWYLNDKFPDAVKSYKFDKQDSFLDGQTRIVDFHGNPKPHEVNDPWVDEHWRGAHIVHTYEPNGTVNTDGPRMNFLARIINANKWQTGAELGVHMGRTYFHILENCPTLTQYYAVDNWPPYADYPDPAQQNHHRTEFFKTAEAYPNTKVIDQSTHEAHSRIKDDSLDFIFIDADHSLEAVQKDLALWTPKVKPTGWILGHDIDWVDVNTAVKAFCPNFMTGPDNVWGFPKAWLNLITKQ